MRFRVISRESDIKLRKILSEYQDNDDDYRMDPLTNFSSSNFDENETIPSDMVETNIKPELLDSEDDENVIVNKPTSPRTRVKKRTINYNDDIDEDYKPDKKQPPKSSKKSSPETGIVKSKAIIRSITVKNKSSPIVVTTKSEDDEGSTKKRNRKQLTAEQKRKENERRKEREKDLEPIICDICGESHKRINVHMKNKHTEGQVKKIIF